MKSSADPIEAPPTRRKSGLKRRLRILFRLAIRRLRRIEFVEADTRRNPKSNPIRWIV